MKIPFCKPSIDQKDIVGVVGVLKSGWLSCGERVVEFENAFAKYIGCKHAIAVNSCTSALFLSLKALDIKEGDEVITSTLTFASTVNVIVHCGAKPVLVDVDETGCINPELIEKVVTKHTRAIIPVHYGGNVCDMVRIKQIARICGLKVIEDAAHAVGACYSGLSEKVGSRDLTCFSFYPTKNMTTGEGGMITTNDGDLADQLRLLRMHGMNRDAWKRYSHKGKWDYDVLLNGYKMNMTDINASLGLTQLKKLDKMNGKRWLIACLYDIYLRAEISKFQMLRLYSLTKFDKVWHLYSIFVKNRDKIMRELNEAGIGTSVFFRPIHLHKAFKNLGYEKGDFPIAEQFYEQQISLPLYPDLTIKQVKYVCQQVNKWIGN